jgi:hypothetical protein
MLAAGLCPALAAQQPAIDEGLRAPTARERESARDKLGDKVLPLYRAALKDGVSPALIIDALVELGRRKEARDIPLIARQVSALDPNISATAVDALKGYGRAGLKAVQALDASVIDAKTRKQAMDLLLLEHVRNACLRDMQVNPYRLDYATRFDELDSTGLPLDDVLLKLLREALPDIRTDLEGTRYWYGGYYYQSAFIDYGALAVASLAKRKPEQLARETDELTRMVFNQPMYWYGGRQRSPVTCELAVFFALRGLTTMIDKVMTEMENSVRWNNGGSYQAVVHMQIAMMQSAGLQEHDAALDRLATAIGMVPAPDPALSQAHYLRARLLLARGEEGAALGALEDAMESSDRPPVIALVDNAFEKLGEERRFKDVLRFCTLRERVLPQIARPWRKDMQEADPDPDALVDEDE